MIRYLFFACLLATTLTAQIGGFARFPPQLRQFMEFTDAQVNTIARLNTSLQSFQLEKLRRSAQVQRELFEETSKPVVDPLALGIRHLELEAIRRELTAEQNKTAAAVQQLLTLPQKAKLEVLQQAIRLQGVICEAQTVNLLAGQQVPGQVVRAPFPGGLYSGQPVVRYRRVHLARNWLRIRLLNW